MRVWSKRPPLLPHRPFQGQGVSVYVGDELPLVYRRQHLLNGQVFLRQGTTFPVGSSSVAKSNRVTSAVGTELDELAPTVDVSAYASGDVYVDVRHYRDDVECEVSHPVKLTLNGGGTGTNTIDGFASSLGYTPRSGGVVRFGFRWLAASRGVQPETFQLVRTAGPSSPSNVSITSRGSDTYEIDSSALLDSATYTFQIRAVNTTLSVTRTLLTISGVQADASGPPAVNNLIVRVV